MTRVGATERRYGSREAMLELLHQTWDTIVPLCAVLAGLAASVHAVLRKRDVRAAAAWVGLAWLVPLVGPLLYLVLGINRIRRRAAQLSDQAGLRHPDLENTGLLPALDTMPSAISHRDLCSAVGRITHKRLVGGNHIEPLINGDEAYPAMLAALDAAERSISLCTYIFETAGIGAAFVDALGRASDRGVAVRVLLDDVGARYSWPRPDRVLIKRGVRTARFIPVRAPWHAPYFNLRNHRKVLVVDGHLGFTGGMNLRNGHLHQSAPKAPIDDLHFRVQGPVVRHLQEAFAKDWAFTTGELLQGEAWLPALAPHGDVWARGIADGPDEDLDRCAWTLHAALGCARRSVLVMTPYFLPDFSLTKAIKTTALRGVEVTILLPAQSNLRLVTWAMGRQLEEVLGDGVKVYLSPAPFDHTKLMLVDDEWTLFGSANWDARSLRLNFELQIEAYDRALNGRLRAHAEARRARARPVTLEELRARPAALRVRDSFARLLSPYL